VPHQIPNCSPDVRPARGTARTRGSFYRGPAPLPFSPRWGKKRASACSGSRSRHAASRAQSGAMSDSTRRAGRAQGSVPSICSEASAKPRPRLGLADCTTHLFLTDLVSTLRLVARSVAQHLAGHKPGSPSAPGPIEPSCPCRTVELGAPSTSSLRPLASRSALACQRGRSRLFECRPATTPDGFRTSHGEACARSTPGSEPLGAARKGEGVAVPGPGESR